MGWRTEEAGVDRVFWRPRSTNGEMGGREEGGTMYSGHACRKCEEIYKAPVSNFYYITTTLVGWG